MVDCYATAIARDAIFVSGEKETWAVSCGDGKVLSKIAGVGGARTQVAVCADGRLVIQDEGRHGGAAFHLLDVSDPGNLRRQASSVLDARSGAFPGWVPPHPPTTACADYPIVYPLVDGRLLVRGVDGLYCYDLRATHK